MASKTRQRPPPKAAKPDSRTALEQLVEEYLKSVQDDEGLTTKTWRYYEGVLVRELVPWCQKVGIKDVSALDAKALKAFETSLRKRRAQPTWNARNPVDRPLAEATVHSYARAVNRLLSWANQTSRIKLHKPNKQERKVLEAEDIRKLEDAAQSERDKLLIRILGDTGMRASELTELTVDDLIEEGPRSRRTYYLRIVGAKDGKARRVGIAADLYTRLKRYADRGRPDRDRPELWLGRRRRPGADYAQLSPSGLGQILGSVAEQAGIDKPTNPHNFRHSRITRLLRAKMDPGLVAKIVGHTSLAMIYEHYDQQTEENAADALVKVLEAEEKEARRR